MIAENKNKNNFSNSGIVLLIALILLATMTIIAIAAFNSATLEMRMSQNYEQGLVALNTNKALYREIASNFINLMIPQPQTGAFTPRPQACCGDGGWYKPGYCQPLGPAGDTPPCSNNANRNTLNIWTAFATPPDQQNATWWQKYGASFSSIDYPGMTNNGYYVIEEICDEAARTRNYRITVATINAGTVTPLLQRYVYANLDRGTDYFRSKDYFSNYAIDEFFNYTQVTDFQTGLDSYSGFGNSHPGWITGTTVNGTFYAVYFSNFTAQQNGVIQEIWAEYNTDSNNFFVGLNGGSAGLVQYGPLSGRKSPNSGVPNTSGHSGMGSSLGRIKLPQPYKVKAGQNIWISIYSTDDPKFYIMNGECGWGPGNPPLPNPPPLNIIQAAYQCRPTYNQPAVPFISMTVRGQFGPTFCDDYNFNNPVFP